MKAELDRALQRLAVLWALVRTVPWWTLWRAYDRSAPDVVWIHHRYPWTWMRWIAREDSIVKDFAMLAALARSGRRFRIVTGTAIEQVEGARIFWTIHRYNPDRIPNYSASMMRALRAAEERGNVLFPPASEAEWWENKAFMHREFERLGIRCPKTAILEGDDPLPADAPPFPILVKEPHSSGSQGVHLVHDELELAQVRRHLRAAGHPVVVAQELLDMRRDLRVTVVGNRIVHHYFRINESDHWKPTSTSHGSRADFDSFPEEWRADILETFARTGLVTGAFDIAWRGDDLSTPPLYLEVSPSYTPNPPPPASMGGRPYSDFKHRLFGRDNYPKAMVDVIFDIYEEVVAEWLAALTPG